jgi:hypothetical protein
MKWFACTALFWLGAACGPTKPTEVRPLAPRPAPGDPAKPSSIPAVPDPDKPPTGPSPEPTAPPGTPGPVTGAPAAHPLLRIGAAIEPGSEPAHAAAAVDAGVLDAAPPRPDAAPVPDAATPPPLPPIPDGGLPPDANRLMP